MTFKKMLFVSLLLGAVGSATFLDVEKAGAEDCLYNAMECSTRPCIYFIQSKITAVSDRPIANAGICFASLIRVPGQCGINWTWNVLLPEEGCSTYTGPTGADRSSTNCTPHM